MRLRLALIVLALSVLACGTYVTPVPAALATPSPVLPSAVPPTSTAVPTVTAMPEDVDTLTIQAVVYVRKEPDPNSPEVGSLTTGETVTLIACDGQWCEIRTDVLIGFVFRGCTNNNPDGLKCEVR
jgi:uncharacterized protein YgiM (DUF1202 family)